MSTPQPLLAAFSAVQPGAYSIIDPTSLIAASIPPGTLVAGILGPAQGAPPNVPLYFTGLSTALALLRGGAGLDVVRFAFGAGAPAVCFIRVGEPTQSTLALAGATGHPVTLTSIDYGAWTTGIDITITSGPTITLTYTDPVSGQTYTEQWNLTGVSSLTAAIIASAINGGLAPTYPASQFVTATSTTASSTLPLTLISATPLAGGVDSTPMSSDWTAALTVMETQNVSIVVPATGDSTIHAQVMAHCDNMSTVLARMERTAVVGGVLGESVAQAVARRVALPDRRVQLGLPRWPGLQHGGCPDAVRPVLHGRQGRRDAPVPARHGHADRSSADPDSRARGRVIDAPGF